MRVAKVTEQEWRTIQKGRRRKIHRYLRCQKFSKLDRAFRKQLKDWRKPALQRLFGGGALLCGLVVCCMMHGQPDSGEVMFSALAVMNFGAYAFFSKRKILV